MRNYVELYLGRVNRGGNLFSFVGRTSDECAENVDAFISQFGGDIDFKASRAYVLLDKDNVYGILSTLTAHYTAVWGSTWGFLQNGLHATESPRESWSHGE